MDIQAALGLKQLEKVEAYWTRRQEIWARYMDALADLPLTLPAPVEENTRHGHHLFTILVDEQKTGVSRDSFLSRMTSQKIGVAMPMFASTVKMESMGFPRRTAVMMPKS